MDHRKGKNNQNKNDDTIRSNSAKVAGTRFEDYSVCQKHEGKKQYPNGELCQNNLEILYLCFLFCYKDTGKSDIQHLPGKVFTD